MPKDLITTTNHVAKDAVTLPDGRKIDAEVVIPDGQIGYGDDQSAASMAGDVITQATQDGNAGQEAYESALEQLDYDPVVRHKELVRMRDTAGNPVLVVFEDRDAAGVLKGMNVLTNWTQPNGKWRRPWVDPRTGRTYYPRIDYVPIDEGARNDLKFKYGITV